MVETLVVVPPSLWDGFGLIVSDRERDAWIARLSSMARVDRLEVGDGGETASMTASRLAAFGDRRVIVCGGPRDPRAMEILIGALQAVGVEVELAEDELSPYHPADASAATPESSRSNVVEIELPRGGDEDGLSGFEARVRAAVQQHGAERVRWSLPAWDGRSVRAFPSPFPTDLAIDDSRLRSVVTELVDELWPGQAPWLRQLLAAHRQRVDPKAEMYAGRSLRDRNRELLVNIVEPW